MIRGFKLFNPEPTYTYADIGLVPHHRFSEKSRSFMNPEVDFFGFKLSLPIIVAPMETVVGGAMIKTMQDLEGLCIVPRTSLSNVWGYRNILSIGLNDKFFGDTDYVCIDVANGFHKLVYDKIREIKKKYPNTKIIAGNVGSVEGYKYLAEAGADAVRVGIGGGGVCTTSIQTGIGVGQASLVREIAECRQSSVSNMPRIIADGGIKNSGDVVKSIALGADVVMVGSIFAGTDESPGKTIEIDGKLYKQLAGQASFQVKSDKKNIEGACKLVPYTGSMHDLWTSYKEGIQSGMAYLNKHNIGQLKFLSNKYFKRFTDAGRTERHPHA